METQSIAALALAGLTLNMKILERLVIEQLLTLEEAIEILDEAASELEEVAGGDRADLNLQAAATLKQFRRSLSLSAADEAGEPERPHDPDDVQA
jgi:hypothetical protein